MAYEETAVGNRTILKVSDNEVIILDALSVKSTRQVARVAVQLSLNLFDRFNNACLNTDNVSLPDLADTEPRRAYTVTRALLRRLAAIQMSSVTVDDSYEMYSNPEDPAELQGIACALIDDLPDADILAFDFGISVPTGPGDITELGMVPNSLISLIDVHVEPQGFAF